jgi:hypothetical protein
MMLGGPSTGRALAQNITSHLTGTVKDAQGAVLPGVTVTATSPALIGSQTAVTETNGAYRFPSLPPGTYTVSFVLPGFQTFTRSNIVLAINETLTVDAQLQLASVKENVTVTAEAPVVDTQSTAVGSTMNTQKLITVPTSTDLWGALARSPGVRMEGFDVGGSHKSEQSSYEAFGVRRQSRIVTEGVDTTEGTGGTGFYQDYYSQNEISTSAAGQDVSMNTPGAAVISTIKSGGNTFKGLYNLSYEPGSFVGNNVDEATSARGFTGLPNHLFWEGHVDLGGPIKRDKLWFFAAYNHFRIDEAISGIPPSQALYQGIYNNYTTKETWKASSKDTVIGYYQYGGLKTPNRGLSALTRPDASVLQESYSWMYNGKYERVWSNRVFSELNIGDFGYHFNEDGVSDYRANPPRIDLGTGLQTGSGAAVFNGNGPFQIVRNKPQVFGTLTYFLPTKHGSHDLKAGFEWLNDREINSSDASSGNILYLDLNGQPNEVRLYNFGDPSTLGSAWNGPNDVNRRAALYFQDRWTASSHVTVTAGVRYDRQRPYYLAGKSDPVLTDIFTAQTIPGATIFVRNNVVPRIGVSWDPKGNGTSVVKAFYGRYYDNLAQLASVDPVGPSSRTYIFNDSNANGLYDGPQELGTLVATSGGTSTTIDPNMQVPHTDEVDLSYERQFWGESSLTVAYVRKMQRNEYATFNQARDGQFNVPITVPVTLYNYDGSKTGAAQGTQDFNLMDVPTSLKGIVQNQMANVPDSVGGGSYNYDTMELAFNKRFTGGFFLDSSFDYVWRNELRQNSSSGSPFGSDPLGVGYFQNVYPTVSNRQTSTNWQAHVSGNYVFPYQIGVGLNMQVQSGWPWARLVSARLPNAGTQTFFLENIDNNQSDTTPLTNLRVDRAFTFGAHRLTVMLDLFNLFNSNAVTNFNLRNGSSFNEIIATLQPRTAELGLRFEF